MSNQKRFWSFMGFLAVMVLAVAVPVHAQIDPVSLPPDFFTYTITGNGETSEGYYYIDLRAANRATGQSTYYMFIMDAEGEVYYYKRGEGIVVADFIAFPDANKMVYTLGPGNNTEMIYVMDDTYTVIDSLNSFDDLDIDGHEILAMSDGTYWTEYWRDYEIDMSEVIEGGLEDAIIRSHVILHLDAEHNIIWEWDSYDHLEELPLSDYDNQDGLLREEFEHLHTNAIEIDTDGNILLSNRTMSLVIKVKYGAGDGYEDGDVMWRLGGGSGNQFTFIDDLEQGAFTAQHDIRRLANGNITVFDNGTLHDPPTAYGREYQLDEENLTATLIWAFHHEEQFAAGSTGSTRRLSNGNTLIGWGNGTPIGATEVTSEGATAWEFVPDSTNGVVTGSYRYTKSTMIGVAARPYIVANAGEGQATVYLNYFGHDDIASYDVTYTNDNSGAVVTQNVTDNVLTLESLVNGDTYNIVAVAYDSDGNASEGSNLFQVTPMENSVEDRTGTITPSQFTLQGNYPNPFNPSTTVTLRMNQPGNMAVRVFDLLGREVATLQEGQLSAGQHRFLFQPQNLASGVYFVRAESTAGIMQSNKMLYLR